MARVPLGVTKINCDVAKGLGAGTPVETIPTDAKFAVIQAQTQALRWRDDGSDPSGDWGMLIPVNESLEYYGPLNSIKLIADVAGGIAFVAFYK